MPLVYSADRPFSFESLVSQATGSGETSIPLRDAVAMEPEVNESGNYVYAALKTADGALELVRVTGFAGNSVTVERGIHSTPITLPQGTAFYVANDRTTLNEFVQANATDEASVRALIADFAEAGASWGDLTELGISDVDDGARLVMQREDETEVKHMSFGQFSAKVAEGISAPEGGISRTVAEGIARDAAAARFTTAEKTKLTGIEAGAKDDQSAAEVPVDASGFDGNLATTDDTVQKVAQKVDDLTIPPAPASWAEDGNTSKVPRDKLPPDPLDVMALDVEQAFTARGNDLDAGGLTNALRLGFNVDGTGFEIRRMLFDADDAKFIVDLENFTDAEFEILKLSTFSVDGVVYNWADGTADTYVAADNTREVEWARVGVQLQPGTYSVRVDDLRIVSSESPGLMSPAQLARLGTGSGGGTPDDDSVSTAKIQDLAVTTAKLADNAVTTGKIAAGAVATSDIGDDQITADKIATNAVTADGLADNAVDAFAIANGAVTNSKLAPSAVTTSKMATEATQRLVPSGGTTGQVLKKTSNNDYAFDWGTDEQGTGGGGGLTQSQVDARIAAYGNAFTAADEAKLDGIETGATADQTGDDIRNALENLTGASKLPGTAIEDASLGTEQMVDDAVTRAKIGAAAVGATELGSNSVTTVKIDGSAVTEAKIDDGAVTTGKIGSLAVQEGKIADGAVTQAKIGNGAVTEGKLGALAVTAAKIAGGAVTLAKAGADLVARLLPTGGTTGQVVTKTATGQEWADAAAGGQTLAETLLDRTAVGVTFSDAGADRLGVPVYFPIGTFDLTGKSGVFFLDIEYAFSGSSIANFGFASGTPGDATASQDHNFTASALLATDPFVAGGDLEGVLFSQDVYSGSTKIGTVDWRTTRLANGSVGYYLSYDAGTGHSATGGATVTATATLNFLPTEGGGTPGEGPSTPVRSIADYESTALPSLAATALTQDAVVDVLLSNLAGQHAAQGVTISNNRLVFARSNHYDIDVGMEVSVITAPPQSQGIRYYLDIELFKAPSATGAKTVIESSVYTKYLRRSETGTGTQSPTSERTTVAANLHMNAGEALGIQIRGRHFQPIPPPGYTLQAKVEQSNSELRVTSTDIVQGSEDRLIPAGGADNQILAKASADDYDTEWIAAPSGGGGGLSAVASDATLTGDGTAGNTLKVANPFTSADETKLDGIETGATADQTGAEMVTALQGLTGNARLQASAVRGLPAAGLDQSAVDTRITTLRPNAFTTAFQTKLQGIETGATADQTAAEIRGLLAGLTLGNRLAGSAIRDIPTGSIADDAITLDKLADAVANRLVIAGGTDGQVLAKSADADYMLEWVNQASGGGGGLMSTYIFNYTSMPSSGGLTSPVTPPANIVFFLYSSAGSSQTSLRRNNTREFRVIPVQMFNNISDTTGNTIPDGANMAPSGNLRIGKTRTSQIVAQDTSRRSERIWLLAYHN